MMNGAYYSRRKFIKNTLSAGPVIFGVSLLGGLAAGACSRGKKTETTGEKQGATDPCEDFSGVSEAELKKRQSLGYVKESPIPDKQCQNCNLYLPPAGDQPCGGCTLFKGPVYASAYCTYWAPQV